MKDSLMLRGMQFGIVSEIVAGECQKGGVVLHVQRSVSSMKVTNFISVFL